MCFVQKKFQQKHLANIGALKGPTTTVTTVTTTVADNTSGDQPIPPVRRFGGAAGVGQTQPQQQQRQTTAGSGKADGDSLVQVDVKGKVRYTRF